MSNKFPVSSNLIDFSVCIEPECWNKFVNPCSANAFTHIETSLLICNANQSTDFLIKVTLTWHWLTTNLTVTSCWLTTKNCEHDVPLKLDHSVWKYKQSPVKRPQRQKQCWTSLKWGKILCLTYPSIPFIYCVSHFQIMSQVLRGSIDRFLLCLFICFCFCKNRCNFTIKTLIHLFKTHWFFWIRHINERTWT